MAPSVGPSVKLSDQLPRLLERLAVLPQTPEVDKARQAVEFAIEQFPEQNPMNQMRFVLGNCLLVGEIEHRLLVNALIAEERRRREQLAEARRNRPAPKWHKEADRIARELLAQGTKPRQLATAVSKRLARESHDTKAIREVLKKSGALT